MDLPNRDHWRGETLSARLLHLTSIFLAHPLAVKVIEALNQRKRILMAARRGRGILILAPPDGGKTRLLKWLTEQFPDRVVVEQWDPEDEASIVERTEKDLVAMDIPNPCKYVAVANEVLKALKHPNFRGADPGTQSELAIEQLKLAKTIFLVVDNVQDIPELRGPKGTSSVGGFFRDIIEECAIIVVFLGTAKAEIVISANDQLRKRVPAPLRLGGYDVSTELGLAQAMRLLRMIDDEMPLAEVSGLGNGAFGRGLACAGDGKIGAIIDILCASLLYTVQEGRERMTIDDARRGYEDHYLDYARTTNPFDEGFRPRRLNLPGEPHFTAIDDRRSGRNKGDGGPADE
jgi:Bacterial TniB protein